MNTAAKELFREEHVSVSQISKYLKCPRSFKFRYIDRIPAETRSAALVFGSAIHEALAEWYTRLKDDMPEPTIDELMETYTLKFGEDMANGLPVMFKDGESADNLSEIARAMLTAFIVEAERPYRVIEVEMPFSLEIIPGKRLVGVLDAVVQDADGRFRILEHKTAAKRWSHSRLASDLQITVYQLVSPQLGLGDNAGLDIQLLLKTKKSGFEVYKTHRTAADKADALETIEGVMKAADAGAYYCVRDWWCGGCEYAARCMAG